MFINRVLKALIPTSNSVKSILNIPEPTRSLLWITDEDPSKIEAPLTIKISITLDSDGVKAQQEKGNNYYAESSMIWTKLPVKPNSNLEEQALYYPTYSGLSPEQRYQYITWLSDVIQPTNLSYVFLYYYGLERHLLVGNFDLAAKEIFRLLQHHDKGSFRSYAQDALIVAALYKKRMDIFTQETQLPFFGNSNELWLVRKKLGYQVTAKDLMLLAPKVGFRNTRFIKMVPDYFERTLTLIITEYEKVNGPILDIVGDDEMETADSNIFANTSIPSETRIVKVPQLLSDDRLVDLCYRLLETAHNRLKEERKSQKTSK